MKIKIFKIIGVISTKRPKGARGETSSCEQMSRLRFAPLDMTIRMFGMTLLLLATAMLAGCTAETKGKYDGPAISKGEEPGGTTGGPARYRGIGINPNSTTEADFRRMAGWGVNHVRWNFENWSDLSNQTVQDYLAWIGNQCDRLEAALPYLAEQGITVNLDIHHSPRGKTGYVMNVFLEQELQPAFVKGWQIIAERFKDNATIATYDLLNEPNDSQHGAGCKSWYNLAIETADSIRLIDKTKKFIFEQMNDVYTNFQPLPGDNWIYSIHAYTPHLLTHQGLESFPDAASYPGTFTTGTVYNWTTAPANWDKSTLRRYYDEVIGVMAFAKNHNVEIYVGEFGCARWAPNHSAYNYIRDCIELFEEEGWHWVYFNDGAKPDGQQSSNMWSAQYNEIKGVTQPVPDNQPTDRLLLLQEYWGRNKK
jgi:hypothetical protein